MNKRYRFLVHIFLFLFLFTLFFKTFKYNSYALVKNSTNLTKLISTKLSPTIVPSEQQNELNSNNDTNNLDELQDPLSVISPTDIIKNSATSSIIATKSTEVEQKIEEKSTKDITDLNPQNQKDKLISYINQKPIQKVNLFNIFQVIIRKAVSNGLPPNIAVLLLMFPLITSIIAFSRHIIGLKGFGIYIPAVLSVAFVSTGILPGIVLFMAVLFSTFLGQKIIHKIKIPYLPRTSLLLWFVSASVLTLLIIASFINLSSLLTINIFPILIIILLAENFIESQLFNSQKEALRITIETLITAIISSLIISLDETQKFVITHPELSLLGIALINIAIGKFTGLRITEYFRFRSLLQRKKS